MLPGTMDMDGLMKGCTTICTAIDQNYSKSDNGWTDGHT